MKGLQENVHGRQEHFGNDAVSIWTIVVAAGSGTRFGGPKHLADLRGKRVLDWSVHAASAASTGVVVVVAAGEVEALSPLESSPEATVVAGGTTRSDSVRNGLNHVPSDANVILVHDGARPLASAELFKRVIVAVRAGADAAVPAVPVTDTIRRVGGGVVDRSSLVAVQTPQAFEARALRNAHAGEGEATDDAGLVEEAGGVVVLVDGENSNLKITNPEDLALAHALAAESLRD